VRARTDDLDLERVRRRRERTRLGDDLPHLEAAIDMGAEDRGDVRERAAFDDGTRAIAHLLRRLKDDEHIADRGGACEQLSCAHGPRCVHVVTAGVHHTDVLRGKRQPRTLGDRERIDVAAHGDDGRRAIAPRDARDEPRACDANDVGDPERCERRDELLGGFPLLPRQLGMPVQVPSQLDEPPCVIERKVALDGGGNDDIRRGARHWARMLCVRTVRSSTRATFTTTPSPGRSLGT
jgi:hypothetical protein